MNAAEARALAEAVRAACLKAAREGYESAAISGLCHEGAVEASLGAIRALKLDQVLTEPVVPAEKKT
ncbi:MAG: acetyltransferase [Gammaproteobacteria bacterium]